MNDRQITINDIGQLEDHGRIIHFFAHLGYQVDQSAPLDHALLGMDTADLRQQIRHIHYIGSEDADFGEIKIYLFEVRSVTVSLIQKMVRCFRDRLENPLLLLTSDYEQLDFVLIEKDLKPSRRLGLAFKQILQPHTLTVNRRNPGPVALRVLRRFTHTEADGLYQWEKLRSAFRLAQWGETYFNNRALFSDYTLNKRLTDPQLNPEWGEEHLLVARRIDKLMSGARSRFTAQPAAVIDRDLYQPLWDQLGFAWQAGLPDRETAASLTYTLYDPTDLDDQDLSGFEQSSIANLTGLTDAKPLALVLATVWNRNLDEGDPDRDQATPDEIPGARVVSLLEGGQAPWVIVTNGKLWRLYAAEASNKATNYYEVDLEEALAPLEGQTQDMAFKYWWLFFRRHAFTGFLERLRQQSADYAQELSNRLKGRVFEEIFPHFAEGFIQQIRVEANTPQAGFNDEALAWVYEGTLTFLYRLMFLLYAESLDLLPLNEAHGYRQISLEQLKKEIAGQAGNIADEAPAKLRAHYSPTGTDLYQRLQTLFAAISQGNPAYNVPFYNGGLFSPDSESGEFLGDHAIPDRYLALGLDRLCRDVDAKTQALAFIDFKSLGVRQLGSIYEGLLEFRLRLAAEPLAVVKEKNREVYLPAAKAGSKRPTATLEKGAVYLETDKRERKATGSYYTPDYIVKYIVTHTVGPMLEEKFTALRSRLTQAQRDYQSHAKLVRARAHENERPEKFWNSPAMQQLADDCLNVRVLDPAMGSGHFLVEVVDFLTNRLIDFLNGWSENPVWAMLEQIRGDILTEMERQGVTIDAERLTRVALLKRAILKRCIYGVDLNGMAVELAKVSLWLDAFTLGAPLSFLDHHLKQGNSLIGTRIKEVEDAVEGTADKAVQLSLFSGGAFTGLSLATDLMRRVSYLSDNTAAQVAESQSTYEDARDHLAYYKRLLDVYTSRWFGNAPGKRLDPALEFLRQEDTREWLKQPAGPPPPKAQFDAPQVAKTALQTARAKRFFHWELEFPEVFFGPGQSGGQDVQLKGEGGFDAVVGNPPYGATFEKLDKPYLSELFQSFQLDFDSYIFFLEHMLSFLTRDGYMSFIVPEVWLRLETNENLRRFILSESHIKRLKITGKVFSDAVVYTCIPTILKRKPSGDSKTRVIIQNSAIGFGTEPDYEANQKEWLNNPYSRIEYLVSPRYAALFAQIVGISRPLEAYFDIAQGLTAYDKYRGQDEQTIKSRAYHSYLPKDDTYKIWLEGGDVSRYELGWSGEYISYGSWLAAPRDPKYFQGHRLLFREVAGKERRIQAQVTGKELYYGHSIIPCLPNSQMNFDLRYVLAIANSNMLSFYGKYKLPNFAKDTFPKLNPSDAQQLPIRNIDFTTPFATRERLVDRICQTYSRDDDEGVLQQIQEALTAKQTDVVHDVLAHLAQKMIDLNQEKRAETERFLNWLEKRLKIISKDGERGLDTFTGKTIIWGYLGDYQKGEGILPWENFLYRLHQNRNRYNAKLVDVHGQIQSEYEHSLAILIPIKQRLSDTDTLIDKIVYRLYGLSDADVEMVQYEHALADAVEKVRGNKKFLKHPEKAVEALAQKVLPAAKRLQNQINISAEEAQLTTDMPGWRQFRSDVRTFLLTGEYNIRHLPDHLDFSTSVVSYAKAVEQAIMQRLFEPFRAAGYGPADCKNKFLQGFMAGERHLTLGSFPYILTSKEKALAAFAEQQYPGRGESLFFDKSAGVRALLLDETAVGLRNAAAHSEALTKADARQARAWALGILRRLDA